MKIPKKIKVGGLEYKVLQGYAFKETELMGQVSHSQTEIRLNNIDPYGVQYPNQKKEECFVHEIIHAIDSVYNNNSLEEKTVDRLSQGLYQVLKDNKLYFGGLNGKDRDKSSRKTRK